MALFLEDGLIAEVEVLEDRSTPTRHRRSTPAWHRYKLKVLKVIRQSPYGNIAVGEVFDVEQITEGAWGGMWSLENYTKEERSKARKKGICRRIRRE
jgi:hypothetical protein